MLSRNREEILSFLAQSCTKEIISLQHICERQVWQALVAFVFQSLGVNVAAGLSC